MMLDIPFNSSTILRLNYLNVKIIRKENTNETIPVNVIQIFKDLTQEFANTQISSVKPMVSKIFDVVPNIIQIEIINPNNDNALIIPSPVKE